RWREWNRPCGQSNARDMKAGSAALKAVLKIARAGCATKFSGADMNEPAVGVEPDLAADRAPAATEREILAEVFPGLRLDHAVEQSIVIVARRRIGEIVGCGILGLRKPLRQSKDGFALDQQEPRAGIVAGDEILAPLRRLVDHADITERCGFGHLPALHALP